MTLCNSTNYFLDYRPSTLTLVVGGGGGGDYWGGDVFIILLCLYPLGVLFCCFPPSVAYLWSNLEYLRTGGLSFLSVCAYDDALYVRLWLLLLLELGWCVSEVIMVDGLKILLRDAISYYLS